VAQLHIIREHSLGMEQARKIAFAWAEQVEQEFGMDCVYEEDEAMDTVNFTRSGVVGTLVVTGSKFELDARLGFLLGAFKERIESEIVKNLDQLLQPKNESKPVVKTSTKAAAKVASKATTKAGAKTSVKTAEKTENSAEKTGTKKKVAKKSST
jgi:putative polyhydroxyalkanoate system protein